MSNLLFEGLNEFTPGIFSKDSFFPIINRSMTDKNVRTNLPFTAYLNEVQLEFFFKNIVILNKLDDMRQAKYQVKQVEKLHQVSVSADVFKP